MAIIPRVIFQNCLKYHEPRNFCCIWSFSVVFLAKSSDLLFPPRTCLHTINSLSFAMEILLSFCLWCLMRAANMTLRLSCSYSERSLLRISAKNRERCSFSSLALYFKINYVVVKIPWLSPTSSKPSSKSS